MEAPGVFRGNPVMIVPYDGFTKPSTIKLFHIDVWIQIHDLPVGYVPMLKSLASKVGDWISSEGTPTDYEGIF